MAVMMETTMTVAPLCFLLCCMLPVHSIALRFNFTTQDDIIIPMGMAEDSVDDMYLGCSNEMMHKVKNEYLEGEKHLPQFAAAWNEAEKCAHEKQQIKKDEALTYDHLQAICLYTAEKVYKEFNREVREKRGFYGSSSLENRRRFQFHSLHFLLTSAIQILNNNDYCYITYRRTSVTFTGRVNQIVRFGSFTSTSYRRDMTDYGNETCFQIRTCSGAYLKKYPFKGDDDAEVLIPPYEKFKIIKIMSGMIAIKGLKDCKVAFVLESAGVESNLNCKHFQS